MKKTLPLILSIVLMAWLVSCGKPETTAENTVAQNPPAAVAPAPVAPAPVVPAPVAPAPAVPAPQAPTPKAPAPAAPAPVTPAPVTPAPVVPAEPAVEPPKENAGLGVIFITDVKQGLFRVKVDDGKVYETDFQRDASGKKEIRVEKELSIPAGKRQLKFVVIDKDSGKLVDREHTMAFAPKSHHVVKLTLTGDDKTIEMEMRE